MDCWYNQYVIGKIISLYESVKLPCDGSKLSTGGEIEQREEQYRYREDKSKTKIIRRKKENEEFL
jgi:hypothetical protein